MERTISPQGAGKAGTGPDRIPFVAHADEALGLDRSPRACRAVKCFCQRFFGRFRGFGNHLRNSLWTVHFSLLCGTAILAGCATPPPTVEIPVAVSCLPKNAPAKPATSTNAALKAMDDEKLVLTIAAERLDLISYAAEADAAIQACK